MSSFLRQNSAAFYFSFPLNSSIVPLPRKVLVYVDFLWRLSPAASLFSLQLPSFLKFPNKSRQIDTYLLPPLFPTQFRPLVNGGGLSPARAKAPRARPLPLVLHGAHVTRRADPPLAKTSWRLFPLSWLILLSLKHRKFTSS